MKRTILIWASLMSIALLTGCRKKESQQQGQSKVRLGQGLKNVQVDSQQNQAPLTSGIVEVPNGVIASIVNSNNRSIIVGPDRKIVELPVGEYRVDSWTMECQDMEGNHWNLTGNNLRNKALFQIVAGQTVKLEIGEPVFSSLIAYKLDSGYRIRHLLKGHLGENIKIIKNGKRPEPPKLKISSSDGSYQESIAFAYG